jgi:2-polyprenyl-3-methyl-5-hydroxy-6-metoxy-1,4-benzoquinol methylase
MLYIGDKLDLYAVLRGCCGSGDKSYVTAVQLAEQTGLNQRWLREWLAQQAAMGVLLLLPGEGDDDESLHYRIPKATAEVLANPDSKQYDISMIQCVPSMVNRAKTMLPEAFRTGIGRPYDEHDVAEGIDRHHHIHIRDVFLPEVLPKAGDGRVEQLLKEGIKVADLGCGAGNLCIALAQKFPNSTFHGYEVSQEALSIAAHNVARSKLRNVFLHDASEDSLGKHSDEYDLVTTFDVLHDAPNPDELIAQTRNALKETGVWLLADIPSKPTLRDNVMSMPTAGIYYSFSACLCMACSLSTEGGLGLGTLGFSIPVAEKMLREGGFRNVKVLLEQGNARWFAVS